MRPGEGSGLGVLVFKVHEVSLRANQKKVIIYYNYFVYNYYIDYYYPKPLYLLTGSLHP